MSMTIRTHKYAEIAYPLVKGIHGQVLEAKYRTLALTFPSMIMQSGLAQAIGFLMAKNNPEHRAILSHLAKLLNYVKDGEGDAVAMHQAVLRSGVSEYQLMSRKALAASGWLKRYTQALLEKNQKG